MKPQASSVALGRALCDAKVLIGVRPAVFLKFLAGPGAVT